MDPVRRGRPRAGIARAPPISNAERQRRFRQRRLAARMAEINEQQINVSLLERDRRMENFWRAATARFNKTFKENPFGYACDVCDRLWFQKDLQKVRDSHAARLEEPFGEDCSNFQVCATCRHSLDRGRVPKLSKTNGFVYPPKPDGLPPLDPISARLISPRLPFMSIRRLQRDGAYGIIGQVINIPVSVDNMVKHLPRQLDQDYAFNVSIKRRLIHKSSYLSGSINKRVLRDWLRYLVDQPLYRHNNISVDWSYLGEVQQAAPDFIDEVVEDINENAPLISRQQTLLWNEENVLAIAPAQGNSPLNIIFDHFAEELSFPQIYYGHGRLFKPDIIVTPFMIATSEIRRKDRRGCTPEHILYMAMKILRLRVVDQIYFTFRCVQETENVTRQMLEDRQFLEDCMEKNLSFLKSIPNSALYWHSKRKDLFAMMRQLGKPSVFLTMSASEMKWPDLIKTLHRLSDQYDGIDYEDPIAQLNRSTRAHLVNEDPVTCCIYFNKLVDIIMSLLQAKKSYNPFAKYRVKDYFMRIEFQHRGSPHAHILLWLENDPKEAVSENMPLTLKLVTDLCSVDIEDLPGDLYANQVHRHTFTCTKRGESSCRFNIPYWPMKETRVLLPMAQDDGRIETFKLKAKKARNLLETKSYDNIDAFLSDNQLTTYNSYLDTIRSTLSRPTLYFKRDMTQIMTNTFNPWIANILNSNMDIQFILDEWSCASYVVEYINKANRGTGNLHRELIKLNQSHPEMTYENLLRKIGSKVLNTVEMSAQEAAWYLLRQNMSYGSRETVYIPTVWPCERQKSFKSKAQMDRQNIGYNSVDVWTKSIIQKYEERPADLESFCLADFVALYTPKRSRNQPEVQEGDGNEQSDEEDQNVRNVDYSRRNFARIIRFKNYDISDTNNYKREMVTLFLPFRNEQVDVLDRDKFIDIYDQKIQEIAIKKTEYCSNFSVEQIIDEYQLLQQGRPENPTVDVVMEREQFAREILSQEEENFDDFNQDRTGVTVSAIHARPNVMSKEQYCQMMRTTNKKQRALILEVIHRLSCPNSQPIQVFFTGPAGCGKTYVLKLIMETFNRYSQQQNVLSNAYVACASTGKAAVNLGGTTVHSAFHITQSRRMGSIARETLQSLRQLFKNVKCIIIDEVSMIGNDILHKVNQRLQEITGHLDENFGGIHIIFCGDFRQLPPVNATPVYKAARNHLSGALLWQYLDFYPLNQVMRQSDIVFSSILTKLGDGLGLTQQEAAIIESRFRMEIWCDENLPGVVRLFHQNSMVDAYNRRAISNGIEHPAIDVMIGYSNANELITARAKLHRMTTIEAGGLPYLFSLAVGYPYMITSNIDIEDGLVNGAIGTMRFIEELPHGSSDTSTPYRVWLEFPDQKTGVKARLKLRSAIVSHQGQILDTWTPISLRTASIALGGRIRCKRTQLPLCPACAITIHKSQGGTFDKAVVLYDKSQPNQLVYVALSRVTSIEGLYLINRASDFTFYHKFGSDSPTVKDIRDEYCRLSQHQLTTLTTAVQDFKSTNMEGIRSAIACTINAQSLYAHKSDIESDTVLQDSDILIVTETWMDDDEPVSIDGYELTICRKKSSRTRTAGGVAIYRNLNSFISCRPYHLDITHSDRFQHPGIGDIVFAEVTYDRNLRFILSAVYLHPGAAQRDIKLFILYALNRYTHATRRLDPTAEIDVETPMMITGDFNTNLNDDDWLLRFLESEFGLSYVRHAGPTTIGNTVIDLTFTRNLRVETLPFVSYFSYHRPLINKISLN